MPGPFFGRIAELTSLEELCRLALRGGTAAGFIVGDPGSGKSRLLAELRARIGPAHRHRTYRRRRTWLRRPRNIAGGVARPGR